MFKVKKGRTVILCITLYYFEFYYNYLLMVIASERK